jgi:hypothetical protein
MSQKEEPIAVITENQMNETAVVEPEIMGQGGRELVVDPSKQADETPIELVRKSNVLIEAKVSFTANEAKFIEKLIASHRDHHPSDKDYHFDCRSLLRQFNMGEENYTKLKTITDSIMGKVMSIRDGDRDKRINILNHCTYHEREGKISTRFHSEIIPFVKKLSSYYTSYYLVNITNLSKMASIKIYQLLKQYQPIGKRTFEIEEFRNQVGLSANKYTRYGDLKKRIILPAQKEIEEKTDILFDFSESKIGKKVVSLSFVITLNEKNIERYQSLPVDGEGETIENEVPDQPIDKDNCAQVMKTEFGVHMNSVRSLLRKFDLEHVVRNIEWVRVKVQQGVSIANLGGYLKTAIENDYARVEHVTTDSAQEEVKVQHVVEKGRPDQELVEELRQELEKSINQKIDDYMTSAEGRDATSVYLEDFLASDVGQTVVNTQKPRLKKILLNDFDYDQKIDAIKSSMPLLASFRLFLKNEILAPKEMDLVFFARMKGITLKKLEDVEPMRYEVVS